jgi:phage gp36-like protein
MAYATLADIEKLLPRDELIKLTDDESLGQVDSARVDEALTLAQAEVDSYCSTRYLVPVSPVPMILLKLTADMALYTLYSRVADRVPEIRAERYRHAVRQLQGIAKGTISLGAQTEGNDPIAGAESNKSTDTNVFSRSKLGGF